MVVASSHPRGSAPVPPCRALQGPEVTSLATETRNTTIGLWVWLLPLDLLSVLVCPGDWDLLVFGAF